MHLTPFKYKYHSQSSFLLSIFTYFYLHIIITHKILGSPSKSIVVHSSSSSNSKQHHSHSSSTSSRKDSNSSSRRDSFSSNTHVNKPSKSESRPIEPQIQINRQFLQPTRPILLLSSFNSAPVPASCLQKPEDQAQAQNKGLPEPRLDLGTFDTEKSENRCADYYFI